MNNLHAEEKVRYFSPESKEKKILILLAGHGNSDGTHIWVGVDTLAKEAGVSERTVQRHLRALEHRGEIEIKYMGSGHRSNSYTVVICSQVDKLDPSIIASRKRLAQENLFAVTQKEFVVPVTTKGDTIVTLPLKDLNILKGRGDTDVGPLAATLFSEQKGEAFKVGEGGMSEETRVLWDQTMKEIEFSLTLGAALAAEQGVPALFEVIP